MSFNRKKETREITLIKRSRLIKRIKEKRLKIMINLRRRGSQRRKKKQGRYQDLETRPKPRKVDLFPNQIRILMIKVNEKRTKTKKIRKTKGKKRN